MLPELIIISNEYDVPQELQVIHSLFENGLERFHLRKPLWDVNAQRSFLDKVKPEFRNKISLHQHAETADEFGMEWIHVREKNRQTGKFKMEKGKRYSTSFHELIQAENESKEWNYCFLSPVFNSISKPDYAGKFGGDTQLQNLNRNIYALGGIDLSNIKTVFERGFTGAALLGSIWSQPQNALENFLLIKKECSKNVHMY